MRIQCFLVSQECPKAEFKPNAKRLKDKQVKEADGCCFFLFFHSSSNDAPMVFFVCPAVLPDKRARFIRRVSKPEGAVQCLEMF